MTDKKENQDKEIFRLQFLFERGVDFSGRSILIDGDIEDGCDFSHLDASLSEMERKSRKMVTIKLKSYGGSVYEALAVIGRIHSSPCKIRIEGYGAIMSAAALIMASADKRAISRFAQIMVHEASYEIGGKHSDIKDYVHQAEKEELMRAEWMEEFTHLTKEQWLQLYERKDYYITPKEALEIGMVDEVI